MLDSFFNNKMGECFNNAVLPSHQIDKLSEVCHA